VKKGRKDSDERDQLTTSGGKGERASNPSMVIVIKEDDFAKGLSGSGMVGSSSLGGVISTQVGVADSHGSSTSGGMNSFNSTMSMMSNLEIHRPSSDGH